MVQDFPARVSDYTRGGWKVWHLDPHRVMFVLWGDQPRAPHWCCLKHPHDQRFLNPFAVSMHPSASLSTTPSSSPPPDYQVHPRPPATPAPQHNYPCHPQVFHHWLSQTSRTLPSGNRKAHCISFLANPNPRPVETRDLVFSLTLFRVCLVLLMSRHHRSKCRAALDRCTRHGGAERTVQL